MWIRKTSNKARMSSEDDTQSDGSGDAKSWRRLAQQERIRFKEASSTKTTKN